MNIQLRTGVASDATAIHALIAANLSAGHLLPRTFEDVESHAGRFVVAVARRGGHRLRRARAAQRRGRRGPLAGRRRGEPRPARRRRARDGAGRSARASSATSTLCAFTHEPSHFVRLGFSIVPHVWVPEKIAHDCVGCSQFRHCGQYAVSLQLRAGAGLRLDLSAPPQRSVAPPRTSVERLRLAPRLGMTVPAVSPISRHDDRRAACRRPPASAPPASPAASRSPAASISR